MKWHIGCSGFHYKEWKGAFYPEKLAQRLWFEYYSSRFHTLELNVTFYRFPQLSILANWYNKSPDHFVFAVKVPRLITHYKQFNACDDLLADFYTTIRAGLKEKLGPVLFQLPPQLKFSSQKLRQILDSLDNTFTNVIEFRQADWWRNEVKEELSKKGIVFCGINYPGLPNEAVINQQTAYYRFHGVPKLYHSSHPEEEIRNIAQVLLNQKELKEVFIYFNNTASLAAIQNAGYLENLIAERFPVMAKSHHDVDNTGLDGEAL
jgi:uncharacterized protein YecE (DUF72 family)